MYYRTTGLPTEAAGALLTPGLDELESLWRGRKAGVGPVASRRQAERPTLGAEDGAAAEFTLTDQLDLALAWRARGSSKTVMVEPRGFEPLTPTLPVWCATSCATAPRTRTGWAPAQ
jgi:hypothetical protein